jgi:hypothetical protein
MNRRFFVAIPVKTGIRKMEGLDSRSKDRGNDRLV